MVRLHLHIIIYMYIYITLIACGWEAIDMQYILYQVVGRTPPALLRGGIFKTWTLDCGLDYRLDHGWDFGPNL